MLKNLFVLVLMITICRVDYSQTKVSGDISTDTKWTKANSPYQITEDIIIFGGVKLEIEPGVTISCSEGKKIKVNGNLRCLGTLTDSIHFDSCKIEANYDVRQSIRLEYCVITNSKQFFYNDYCENTVFKNCTFYNNNVVVYNMLSGKQMYIDNCTFRYNNICIYYKGSTVSNSLFLNNEIGINYANDIDSIKNCTFSNNSQVAIKIDNGTVENNLITNNTVGINTLLSSTSIKNNIISNNLIGVLNNASKLNFSNNQIFFNSEFNFKHTYAGIIDIPGNCWGSSNIDSLKNTNTSGVKIEPVKMDCSNTLNNSILLSQSNDYKIYPTFVTHFLHIKTEKLNKPNIRIINHSGQLVMSKELKNNEDVIDVSVFPNGIYYIIFQDNQSCARFIKTK